MWRRTADSLDREPSYDILFSVFPRRRRPKPELGADRSPLPLVSTSDQSMHACIPLRLHRYSSLCIGSLTYVCA